MQFYADERREEFQLSGDLRAPTSALLPMGGAVSNVAGPNWALVGDAAACVNPLNGEGIDYGLEGGRLVVDLMAEQRRPLRGVAATAARALRRGLLDRPPAGRPGHRATAAADPRPGRDAQRLADDAGAALDGQPGHRRGPRPRGPGLALGRAPLGAASTTGRRSADRSCRAASKPYVARQAGEVMVTRSTAANGLGRLALRGLGLDVRWTGAEHLPPTGPVVLAATHVSYPDFVLIERAAVTRGRYVRFLTRHDVWEVPVVPWFMDRMRHIPVNRQAPAYTYLRARRELEAGEAVCAFPEAGISYSYTVRPLMRGAAPWRARPARRWCRSRSGAPNGSSPWATPTRRSTGPAGAGSTSPSAPRCTSDRAMTSPSGPTSSGTPHRPARGAPAAAAPPAHDPARSPPGTPPTSAAMPPRVSGRASLDVVPFNAVTPSWGPDLDASAARRCRRRVNVPTGSTHTFSRLDTGFQARNTASSRAPARSPARATAASGPRPSR